MELLIMAMVGVFLVKNAAVDTTAMVTGRTPPSHAYRMARLREQARTVEPDPDTRAGFSRVLRHWYLDACEDVDHWRAHRRQTRPQRRAAAQARRQRRARVIREWARRPADRAGAEDIVDAEVVEETPAAEPQPQPERPGARPHPGVPPRPPLTRQRRTTTTTTSSTVTEEEEVPPTPGAEVAVVTAEDQVVVPPLAHRRLVLMTMLANAGFTPDLEAIEQMTSEEVDAAISALIAHERATRAAAHTA